jgi:LysM repeat protein
MVLGLSLGLLLVTGLGRPNKQAQVSAQGDPASEIFQLINQFRADRGLPPLQYNATLAVAAQNHANWMASSLLYSHYGQGGSSPQTRAAAAGYIGNVTENIVGGTNMSPRQGIIWWEHSPIHYNTLVTTQYVEAGVGYSPGGGQNMYVLVVGRELDDDNPIVLSNRQPAAQPLIITPIELAEPREDGSIVHVMQQGQAMWTIAAYYDVDLDYLYLINSLTEDDVLHPGREVYVQLAEGQSPPPTPTPPLTHVVQDGESAWSIASVHGIELDFLYLLNNINDSVVLQPGQKVVVRLAEGQAPPPTPTPPIHHIVRSGDSLWNIAAINGLTIDELMTLNNLTQESVIHVGDELLISFPTPTALPTDIPATPVPASSRPASLVAANLSPSPEPANLSERVLAATPDQSAVSDDDRDGGNSGAAVALVVLVGLSVIAGGAVIFARRREERQIENEPGS